MFGLGAEWLDSNCLTFYSVESKEVILPLWKSFLEPFYNTNRENGHFVSNIRHSLLEVQSGKWKQS